MLRTELQVGGGGNRRRDIVPHTAGGPTSSCESGVCVANAKHGIWAPRKAWIVLLTLLSGLLDTSIASAAQVDHLVWDTVPSPQGAGAPFQASLTAEDAGHTLVSDYSGAVEIKAMVVFAPSLVISEVDIGTTNQIELTNPSTNSVDISSWKVVFYDRTEWPHPVQTFTFPADSVCPAGSVFVVKEGGVAPGGPPQFQIGSSLYWYPYSANQIAVVLLDQTNGLVDFFCASTGNPYLITDPIPVIPGAWSGETVPFSSGQVNTYQRQGFFNHHSTIDWVATTRSIGILNSNLFLPFTATSLPISTSPQSLFLTNGTWSGYLSVLTPGSHVVLRADDGNGHPGTSNPFDVLGGSPPVLSLPTQTSASHPGTHPASIEIPSAIAMDLVFDLHSDTPAKIAVPPQVVLAAGSNWTAFSVTNLDDGNLDGIQLVTVTASNLLYTRMQGVITNFSTPVQLELALPSAVNQQEGLMDSIAQLSTRVPVGSNFQAAAFSSDPSLLVAPPFIHIPGGQTNASFDLIAPSGTPILGSRGVTVSAHVGPEASTNGLIMVSGEPSTNLILHLPDRWIEGAGAVSNATVEIAGTLLTNLTIDLTSSAPAALVVPDGIVLPAGQTSVLIPMIVHSNPTTNDNLLVTISASALGFIEANAAVTIQDRQLDHFGVSGIPLSQTAHQPFTVTILAQNRSGDTLTDYSGTASLSASGSASAIVTPNQTGSFTNGAWSGTISMGAVATNVMVVAQDGTVSGQSNPFNVGPVLVQTIDSAIADLIYDPGTDRIYASVPESSDVEPNTVMRVNPYTASIEAYIPVDTNPGIMALSASNQYLYVGVQGGYSVQRIDLASQTPDSQFALPGFYAVNLIGLPDSPESVAIHASKSTGLVKNFIFDGTTQRTNLADLELVPGLENFGILSSGVLYLPDGLALNPTNDQPVGQFPVSKVVEIEPVQPDSDSGSVFFLSQGYGQPLVIVTAYDMTTFTLQGTQEISGILGGARHLIRWGTNGLAFSTGRNQLFLTQSPLISGTSEAALSVSQDGPVLASMGELLTYTVTITNSGAVQASDVIVLDTLPTGSHVISANTSQGSAQVCHGVVSGSLGTIAPHAASTLTVTVQGEAAGTLTNRVTVVTSSASANSARQTSIWLTSVSTSTPPDQVALRLLPIKDVVFNPTDGKLYASVSGAAADCGNSIVGIDPLSLQIIDSVFVGSEPGALALSQDGRYLYVYLESTASIELVDLLTGTVTFQESIYPFAMTEMFVLPDDSHSLLLSQHTEGSPSDRGVLMITDGTSRLVHGSGDLIQPSMASNAFYFYKNSIVPPRIGKVVMDGTNTTAASTSWSSLTLQPQIRSEQNVLFFSSGDVIDPESMLRVATFPGLAANPAFTQPLNRICPDMASGRVYYLTSTRSLRAFSLNDYQLVESFPVPGMVGTASHLVRWGATGLAFATTGGQLFSIQTAMVPTNPPADLILTQTAPASADLLVDYLVTLTVSNQGPGIATSTVVRDFLPDGMRFVSASSTQGAVSTDDDTLTAELGTLNAGASADVSILLRPNAIASAVNYVCVAADEPDPVMTNNRSSQSIEVATSFSESLQLYIGDLAYDPTRGKVFATVQNGGAYSNSIIQVDPQTGNVERSLPSTFPPEKITVTRDGQFLYIGTATATMVDRINIQAWTNDFSFSLGNSPSGIGYAVGDFAPLPGQPDSIGVALHSWYGEYNPRVAIFDHGVSRPDRLTDESGGTYYIRASTDASALYVINGGGYGRHAITPSGIEPAMTHLDGYQRDFEIDDDWLLTEGGKVINIQNDLPVGDFPVTGFVSPDLQSGIVYFLVQGGSSGNPVHRLTACSTNLTNILWRLLVPEAVGKVTYSLTRCGPETLAFATRPLPGGVQDPAARRLFFVRTSAVPEAGDLVLSVHTNAAFAGGYLTNTFTVLNEEPYYATGVAFSNVLVGGSTFVSANSTMGTCLHTNGIVTCAVGSMIPASEATITVVSSVPTAGSIPLQASVSQNEPDLEPSNNHVSLTQTIDSAPSVNVNDLSVYRQNGLTASFNVVLASPRGYPVQLTGTTMDGSAHAPADYVSSSRIVKFPPGTTNKPFSVTVKNSGLAESDLVFYLNISATPLGPTLASAACTLINDTFYDCSVANVSLNSSLGGATNAVFSVTLSGSNSTAASVDYFTQDGSAASGTDYLGKAGTMVFAPGITNQTIAVPVYPLADSAPIKMFHLILANPVNVGLAVPQASALIVNPELVVEGSRTLSDGRFSLTVNGGLLGSPYVLLASTNFADWTAIYGFLNTNPPVTIYDPHAALYIHRFYRIGPLSSAPPLSLSPSGGGSLEDNGFSALLSGLPGIRYEIEASTNLFDWQLVTSLVMTNPPFDFRDPTATNFNRRFYRAVMP